MIDESFIKKIETIVRDAVPANTLTINGKVYSDKTLHVIADEPQLKTIMMKSLTGLVDYLTENREGFCKSELFIMVEDYHRVILYEKFKGEQKKRCEIIIVSLDKDLQMFPFKSWQNQEQFIINCITMLQPSSDKEALLANAEKIRDGKTVEFSDNRVTQNIHIKKGAHLMDEHPTVIQNIYKLKPYRTFREIEQPESEFNLRIRSGSAEKEPQLALFEADGDAWKHTAILCIKAWLQERIKDIPIFA